MNAPFDQIQTGIWYLLAGVIIGFSASTLWEWLYFRRKRIQPKGAAPVLPQSGAQEAAGESQPARLEPAGARMDIESPGAVVASESVWTPPPIVERTPARTPSSQRSKGHPDDLTLIPGIDQTIQARLYRANIFTWHHVATSEVEYLRQAAEAPADVAVEQWPAQARALAERNGRKNASYSGPLPDDLTQIADITPQQMKLLYMAGICTARQLAATRRSELETLFANSPGSPFGYDRWLSEAAQAVS